MKSRTKQKLMFMFAFLIMLCMGVSVSAAKKVHTIGDSTMANYDETTITRGWGMYFGNFLTNGWTSVNYAKGGRDARQGYTELWQNAKNNVEAGDYVIVQFAHNDEMFNGVDHDELAAYLSSKGESISDTRGTNPSTTYKEFLKKICDEVVAKGATPVLVGPACRFWWTNGEIRRSGRHDLGDSYDILTATGVTTGNKLPATDHTMDYAYQMKQLADANGWAYVDLTQGTKTLFESYGSARCENELQSIKVKDGVEGPDGTHFRSTGALLVARLCAQMMKDQGILADNINIPTALSVSPETGDMGDVYNGQAAVKEFTLNGFGLEPSQGTISVTATDGVKLSTDRANWQDALSIDYTSGTIVQNFYARATMTTAGAFSSTITVTSGSTNIEVPLTANVVELGGGEPFTATWALTENMTPVVEGNATATDVVISNMGSRMKNETLQAYGGSSLGSWSAGEDDDPSRYIEFNVTCPEGKTLDINNISLKVGGVATNDICCHVYYSTDGYITRTTLYSPTVMSSGVMNEINATPVIKLEEGESVKVRVYPWSVTNYASGKYIAVSDVVISGQSKNAGGVDIDGSITYTLDKGGLNQGDDAVFNPETMTAGFIGKTWTAGSGITVSGTSVFRKVKNDNSTVQATQTTIKNPAPKSSLSSSAVADNTLTLTLTPEDGFNFVPSKVSFKAARYGTNSGNINAVIKAGTQSYDIALNKAVARGDNGEDITSISESIENVVASGSEPLKLEFSFLGLGGDKSMGISDLVIEGKLVGSASTATKYALYTSVSPAEAGSITMTPELAAYKEGSTVTLKATKNFGYAFKEWQDAAGATVSTDAETTVTMDAEKTMKAVFEAVPVYTVTTKVANDAERDGLGSITLTPNDHDGKYEAGTQITAVANESKIIKFTNWEDGSASVSRQITVNEDMTITANYEMQDFIAVFDASKTASWTYEGTPFSADVVWDANRNAQSCIVKLSDGSLLYTNDGKTVGKQGTPVVRNRNDGIVTADKSINGLYQNGYNTAEIAWQYKFSTVGFTTAKFVAEMAAKNAATANWKAQISTDGKTYDDLGEAWTVTANAKKELNFDLPAGKETVYVRIMGVGTDLLSDTYTFTAGTFCGLDYATNSESGVGNVYVLGEAVVVADEEAPVLVTPTTPADNATGVSASGRITISFNERIESAGNNAAITLNGAVLTPTWNSRSVSFDYTGLDYSTSYVFTMPANYVQDKSGNKYAEPVTINFTTMTRPTVTKALYDFIVPDDGTIDEALAAANNREDKTVRYRVFIKNSSEPYVFHPEGTVTGGDGNKYDNPISKLTAPNTSFIGESIEGVVLTNVTPPATWNNGYGNACPLEGIGSGDVLDIEASATDCYFQNLTVKSSMGDAHGRDIAVQDNSNHTIFKDACLWAYQDTYVSRNNKFYFEGGVIRGRTDFICGSGDVFFNGVEIIMCEKGGYVVAPQGNNQYGYVFKDCTIKGGKSDVDGNYYLGRAWSSAAETYFINTTMEAQPKTVGWSDWNNGPTRFAENGSKSESGAPISLSDRATSINGTPNAPELTDKEAETIGNMASTFGEWQPTLLTEQAPVPTDLAQSGFVLSWTGSEYALLYAIVKDGQVIDFTTESEFTLTENGEYAVRAANEMGGLSAASDAITVSDINKVEPIEEEKTVDLPTTGVVTNTVVDNVYYNLDTNSSSSDDDGSYLSIGQTTDMSSIEDTKPGSTDIKDNFNGMILMVGEGSGKISVSAKTEGNAKLAVKVGNGAPTTAQKTTKGDVEVNYNVSEDTYVYIYSEGTSSGQNAIAFWFNNITDDAQVKIYGITVTPETTAVGNISANGNSGIDDSSLKVIKNGKLYIGDYNVSGHRVK